MENAMYVEEQDNLIALVRKRAAIVQEGAAFYNEMTELADAIAETPENQEMFTRELRKKMDLLRATTGVWLELVASLVVDESKPDHRHDGRASVE